LSGGGRVQAGFLHLQLGQEIIYLMLAGALAAAIFMASLVAGRRELEEEIARLRAVETPPIITLAEAEGYTFASGSADISAEFRTLLVSQAIPLLVQNSETYGATVVEVVGHTDESPLRSATPSNLDQRLLAYLEGESGEPLHAADNAGLGLARAAAVAQVIRTHPDTDGLSVIPMSAAQTIEPGDVLAAAGGPLNEQQRRRIEIRLRRPVLQ
jgi:flagellar motor protein MotB